TIHLCQQLVQCLLTLVISTESLSVSLLSDGIDLIDKYNTGRFFICLLEQVTHLGRAHADKHFHELRSRDREERHMRFSRHCFCQQGLSCSRRPHQQRALRAYCSDLLIFLRIVQEINDLCQQFLCFVLPC